MKSKLILFTLFLTVSLVRGQDTAFTYQGRLTANGTPANGSYELQIGVHDAASGGNMVAGPITLSALAVADGLFTVALDYGAGVFDGAPRWLQIGVRTNGSIDAFITLLPRQSINSTPYAIQAAGLTGTLPDAQLSANVPRLNASNTHIGPVNFDPPTGAPFSVGNNKKIANLNADLLDGKNSTDFVAFDISGNVGIGTTSPTAKLHVAGDVAIGGGAAGGGASGQTRRLRIDNDVDAPNTHTHLGLLVGGPSAGDPFATFAVGGPTRVWGIGVDNSDAQKFKVTTRGGASGMGHVADGTTMLTIDASGNVGIGTSSPAERLRVLGPGASATIMTLQDSSEGTRLRFDYNGSVTAIGTDGNTRFDLGAGGFSGNSSIPNALSLTIGGNVGIGTTTPEWKLDVAGRVKADSFLAPNFDHFETGGQMRFRVNSLVGGFKEVIAIDNDTGRVGVGTTTPTERLHVSGNLRVTGTINPPSDRNVKSNFAEVDSRDLLERVVSMQIQTWTYTNDTFSTRHIGPIAQDFHAAFGVGADDKHIATVDADGVALAAIQGLNQKLEDKLEQKQTEITELQRQNADLLKWLEAIEARLR